MNFKRFLSIGYFLLFISQAVLSQSGTNTNITAEDIKTHITFLASDDLKGRYPGTAGSHAASEYIRGQFRGAGLQLLEDDGFQNFEVVVSVSAGENNVFKVNEKTFIPGIDFTPYPYTKNMTVLSDVVFAGYGLDIEKDTLNWNDYKGIDIKDKWVLILRGDPEYEKQESRFALYADDRDKVLAARDKGASGVIFVSGSRFDKTDDLVPMIFDKTQSTAGLPVIHIKRTVADHIFGSMHVSVDSLESLLITGKSPFSFAVKNTTIDATTEVIQEKVTARNVVAMVEGSDPLLKNSYIIVGAHYDHLGLGGPGSGSRFLDTLAIHNGADDNASGVAGVLELASFFGTKNPPLKRSVLFVCFDGEELGILGSKYFVSHSPVDLKNVVAMVNFDMIGRLKDDDKAIMIGGTGTSTESEDILKSLDNEGIKLNFSPEGFGPSDHASFYAENIPVFFFSTGAHEDYHTPDDDWDRINYQGEKDVCEIGKQLVENLADRYTLLTFQEAGPKEQQGRAGYKFKVTLGIMPDFTSTVEGGLGVGGVKKDGPAFKGGMLKGDVITAIDGKPVNDIYDYMGRLKLLQPGQRISVDVLRGDKKEILIIQL